MANVMECEHGERMSRMMSLSLDGRLPSGDQQELRQHVAGCPVCRAEWEAMQRVSALFEGAEMVGPPLGFAVRVERRLASRTQSRKRTWGGLALLTSSLSLVGVTVGAVVLIVLGILVWQWLGPQGTGAVSQVASGVGLVGKGATLFLSDLLLRYGPLLLVVGVGLVVLIGAWTWLFVHRPGNSHRNGYV